MTLVHTYVKRPIVVYCYDPNAEADDLIATGGQHHPTDNHIIISTDSDFYQLITT